MAILMTGWSGPGRAADAPWTRHVVDDQSRGADGVRLADANGDGRPDIATGWEEGGQVRVYLNPGPDQVQRPWPAVTVGKVRSPEDAVLADLDGDGALDVVSACEGKTRSLFFHWAPAAGDSPRYLDSSAWQTTPVPATAERMWMFALPVELDGQHGVDLVVGSKGPRAAVGWLQAPRQGRDVPAWRWHPLYKAGWIMSLVNSDLDGDGDPDVIVSDRKGKSSGVLWLENPGPAANRQGKPWPEHRVGAAGREVMFLDVVARPARLTQIVATAKKHDVLIFTQGDNPRDPWQSARYTLPGDSIGTLKAVRYADDLLGDGEPRLVLSCEHADAPRQGVFWTAFPKDASTDLTPRTIAGGPGVKFDLVELLDLDGDGDLDVLTCEERDQLGVFWYENPSR